MLRLPFWRFDNEGVGIVRSLSAHLADCSLERRIVDLVYLRVSQLNDCRTCLDVHSEDALAHGVDEQLLNDLAVWRETPLLTERERGALAWAEALTDVSRSGAPDALYREMSGLFSEVELVDLTLAIAHMNAVSRLAVAFRSGPPPMPADSESAAPLRIVR